MKPPLRLRLRGRVEFNGKISPIIEQLNAREGGAEADFEWTPGPGLGEGGSEFFDVVPKETDGWDAGESPAFPHHQIRVQMADDGLLDLRQAAVDGFLGGEKGQGGGVVAKEKHALLGAEIIKGGADFGEVALSQSLPFGPVGWLGVGVIGGQGEQRRGDAEQDIVSHGQLPKRFKAELCGRSFPTGEAHAAHAAKHDDLADFMIANGQVQAVAELFLQFAQTFLPTGEGRRVAHADEGGIGGVVAIYYHEVGGRGDLQETIQLRAARKGITHPDEMVVGVGKGAYVRLFDNPETEITASRLFGGAGIVNVTQDQQANAFGRLGVHGDDFRASGWRVHGASGRGERLDNHATTGAIRWPGQRTVLAAYRLPSLLPATRRQF